jgi:carboxymethylenebutenolidase
MDDREDADGNADCYFGTRRPGLGAAVLVWPDIFGLRPAFRTMGDGSPKRLFGAGGESFYRVRQASVAKNKKVGTQGSTAWAVPSARSAPRPRSPDRVGAIPRSGGGLVTNMPNSPHLQASKTKARLLIAIAANDATQRPGEKDS